MNNEQVTIDGSHGEGGGQLIRTALALSAITGRPLEIDNIRAGRAKPGLQPQHLAAVNVAAQLCDADISGTGVGTTTLRFMPRHPVRPGAYRYAIGTAGATTLVAQTALPPLLLAGGGSTLLLEGGTHVPFAPPAEYLEEVLAPALERAGASLQVNVSRAGYYPRGGGELGVTIEDAGKLTGFDFVERGDLRELTAFIVTSELPDHVSERGAASIQQDLRDFSVQVVRRNLPSNSPGAAVVIAAHCTNGFGGFAILGERGKPMEQVVKEAALAFRAWWRTGAGVDSHLADQLILPAALAGMHSRWTTPLVTEHLRTVAWVVRQFLPVVVKFDQLADGLWLVDVR